MIVTVSRIKAWLRCPRLHRFAYLDRRRPRVDAIELRFGTAWHRWLESWWLDVPVAISTAVAGLGLSTYDEVALEVMAAAYDARHRADRDNFEVIGVEKEFRILLEADAGEAEVAGKLDVLLRQRSDGSCWVLESKSTGEDIDPEATYWERLRLDAQISTYILAAETLAGQSIAGVIYDVAKKPSAPRRATPIESREYTQGKGCKPCGGKARGGVRGTGCAACAGTGWEEAPRLHARMRDHDETVEEYQERIAEAIIAEPESWLRRVRVQRLAEGLDDDAGDVVASALLMQRAVELGHHPKNPSACRMYGRTCAYAAVCRGEASIADESQFRDSPAFEELADVVG